MTSSLSLHEAAKCALVSTDSTMKSNLSVGLPLDLVCYRADSFVVDQHMLIDELPNPQWWNAR